MFDILGDVHGHADKLVQCLELLGYREINGIFQHPDRKLISLGDIIDRGPYQRDSVNILRSMQQAGFADVVMANHEFNAVSWALQDTKGNPLRPHSEKNYHMHSAFLEQADPQSQWYRDSIEWFKSLPLLLENEHFRCIHASWDTTQINYLKRNLDAENRLKPEQWALANDKSHQLYEAVEHCLKGPEILLPEEQAYRDANGILRRTQRTRWWSDADPENEYPTDEKPIFFGHYWMQGTPKLLADKLACLDWSVAKDGVLCAYRYNGEVNLKTENLLWV